MIIKCKNMTHAMKAKKILNESGISASVEKINNIPNYSGCVYSIVFGDIYFELVIKLLKENHIVLHKTELNNFGDDFL